MNEAALPEPPFQNIYEIAFWKKGLDHPHEPVRRSLGIDIPKELDTPSRILRMHALDPFEDGYYLARNGGCGPRSRPYHVVVKGGKIVHLVDSPPERPKSIFLPAEDVLRHKIKLAIDQASPLDSFILVDGSLPEAILKELQEAGYAVQTVVGSRTQTYIRWRYV